MDLKATYFVAFLHLYGTVLFFYAFILYYRKYKSLSFK